LHEITCEIELGLKQKVLRLLQHGCNRFAKEVGILAKTSSRECQIVHQVSPADLALSDGDSWDLRESPCAMTLSAEKPVALSDLSDSQFQVHPVCRRFGLRSYLGMPVYLAGKLYGTLCGVRPMRVNLPQYG
jgi:GAF domain-containing protein